MVNKQLWVLSSEFDGKGIEAMPVLIDSYGRYGKSIVISPNNSSVEYYVVWQCKIYNVVKDLVHH